MATINRRNWIKTSALTAAGLTFFSGAFEQLSAMPAKVMHSPIGDDMALTDQSVITSAPTAIKARLSANENPFGP